MFASILMMAAGVGAQDTRGAILIDRGRIDRTPPAAAPPVAAPAPPAAVIVTKGSTTPIAGIRFAGAKAPAPVADAARGFIGRTANPATLAELAAALSAAYAEANVALYTIAIPTQDFAGGTVIVDLTEGRIDKAALKAAAKAHPLLRARMAPLLAEAPLSRATFERQITLMRAIPGLTFDTDFQDPQSTGALALTVTPKQRYRKASIGFSNRGVDLLGDGQFDAKLDFFGLARDGDQLSFNASAASDLRRFRYGAIGYTAPITASGLSVTANAAYLETRPKGLPIVGRAKLAGVSLAYPLIRDFHRSADISLGIDGLDSDNAVFGNLVATERTRAARVAASFSSNKARRSVAFSGSLSKGLDILGARVTQPLAETGFIKAVAGASIGQQIGKRLFARVSASGQYSGDRLPAAERFSLGGEALGRAFDTALLTGDRGAGGLGEIAIRPIRKAAFAQSEAYAFVDGGVIAVLPRGGGTRLDYSLASAGAGFRARFRDKAELGLEAAHAIDDPYPGYPEDWRISVGWRLSL